MMKEPSNLAKEREIIWIAKAWCEKGIPYLPFSPYKMVYTLEGIRIRDWEEMIASFFQPSGSLYIVIGLPIETLQWLETRLIEQSIGMLGNSIFCT